MGVALIIRTRRFLLFLFLTTGCNRHSSWIYQEVVSDYPLFDSHQLTFTPENKFNGLEVQFLKGNFGTIGFFNILCREIDSENFSLLINGSLSFYKGILMAGGQRLQLPPEATSSLISALLEGNQVIATFGNYYSIILPANFAKLQGHL